MSDLIKEAIADAKAVREMAVKQAKAALEEAFTPRVEKIVSQRLQTEMEDEEAEYDEMEESVELGTDDDHEEAMEDSGLTEEADTSNIGDGDNKEPSAASSEESTEDIEGEIEVSADHDTAEESELTESEDFDEDDVDLEGIIRELEDETEEFEDDEEVDDDDFEVEDDEESDFEVEDDEEIEIEEDDDMEFGDEEIDVEDDEEDLELEIEDDEDMDVIDDEEGEVEDDEELDLESISAFNEIKSLRTENAKLKAKLSEAIKAVKIQKNQLNEINILNAKLLFTNKVFGQYNLDDSSKIKVVENFDRAKTIREVKLIFATLMENMKADKRNNKASRLVEGASGVIKSTKSNTSNTIVDGQDDVRNRVHKLMGLKNK